MRTPPIVASLDRSSKWQPNGEPIWEGRCGGHSIAPPELIKAGCSPFNHLHADCNVFCSPPILFAILKPEVNISSTVTRWFNPLTSFFHPAHPQRGRRRRLHSRLVPIPFITVLFDADHTTVSFCQSWTQSVHSTFALLRTKVKVRRPPACPEALCVLAGMRSASCASA